jgi:hypothetical protein
MSQSIRVKPGTVLAPHRGVNDTDIEIAIYQYIDGDGIDEQQIIKRCGFDKTFSTLTGTIPDPRKHIYWKQSRPCGMTEWSATQESLAQNLGTDVTVKNPSRVDRLAGTVSYPPEIKVARGYVTELTVLERERNGEVCTDSFRASFPFVEPVQPMPPPIDPAVDGGGNVPLDVIEAALNAIPPLNGKGNRDTWLDIQQCARDANPNSFALVDAWQRQSNRYDPSDSCGWELKTEPRHGCYLGLFKLAKDNDDRWWCHHSGEVMEWWQQNTAKMQRDKEATPDDPNEPQDGDNKPQKPKPPRKRFPVLYEHELVTQPQLRYLIDDWITEDSVVVIWGKSQSLKSFLLLEISLCMTHGMPWHGKRTQQGAVAYVAAEGSRSIGKRVRGWKQHNKITHATSPFVTIPTKVNILIREEVEDLILQLQEIECERGFKFMIVNIDTLAKCMVGGDENHARDMGIAVSHCDLIRERMGCSVIVVHHSGKDVERGMRGSYALEGGINTGIYVERHREEGFILVEMQKQKDDDDDLTMRLRPVKIHLPLREGDDWRKPESTLVLEEYVLDCAKATPLASGGTQVDMKYADLMSMAIQLADNSRSAVSAIAKTVFRHERHTQRVKDAVPLDWIEVDTQFGVRQLRRVIEGTRQYVECRHVKG